MKFISILTGLCLPLFISSAFALDVVVPAQSLLREIPNRGAEDYLHKFTGMVELRGSFSAAWVQDGRYDGELPPPRLSIRFKPEPRYSKLLPYFKGRDPVTELYLVPVTAALEQLVSPTDAQALLSRQVTEVHGHSRITVEGYAAEITCDAPAYSGSLVSAMALGTVQVVQAPIREAGGCH